MVEGRHGSGAGTEPEPGPEPEPEPEPELELGSATRSPPDEDDSLRTPAPADTSDLSKGASHQIPHTGFGIPTPAKSPSRVPSLTPVPALPIPAKFLTRASAFPIRTTVPLRVRITLTRMRTIPVRSRIVHSRTRLLSCGKPKPERGRGRRHHQEGMAVAGSAMRHGLRPGRSEGKGREGTGREGKGG